MSFVKYDLCGRGSHVKDDYYCLKIRPVEGQMKINDGENKKRNCVTYSERKPYNSYKQHYDKKTYNLHLDIRKNFTVSNGVNEGKKYYAYPNNIRNYGYVHNGTNVFVDS